MALDKVKRGCPYGKELAAEIEDGGNEAIIARLEAIESKLAAVLAAKAADDGKTLQIDSNGKVALVTV
jgi:hypothetical protein